MASIGKRIEYLEDLYRASSAGEEPGRDEERERRDFLEKLRKVRAKAESEERWARVTFSSCRTR
jgi:hypothetical protein